jgi:hypothetical protein
MFCIRPKTGCAGRPACGQHNLADLVGYAGIVTARLKDDFAPSFGGDVPETPGFRSGPVKLWGSPADSIAVGA